jgi:hypothetical protein
MWAGPLHKTGFCVFTCLSCGGTEREVPCMLQRNLERKEKKNIFSKRLKIETK